MKAAVLRVTTILAVVIAFTAVSAQAQGLANKQTFVVPFSFNVGRTVLPAGEYTFTAETLALRIQSKDGRSNTVTLPQRTLGATQSESEIKLIFKRYGDTYYLAQVWLPGGVGREMKRQRPANRDVAQTFTTVEVPGFAR
jgi:hypothetical protein